MNIDLDALVRTMRITAGYTAPVLLMPHEARALVAEVERLRAEVERERAAVVAWLRDCALDPETTGAEMRLFQNQATTIERGEHRRGEGG